MHNHGTIANGATCGYITYLQFGEVTGKQFTVYGQVK